MPIPAKPVVIALAGAIVLSGCARQTDARSAGFFGGIANELDGTYARQRQGAQAQITAASRTTTALQGDIADLEAARVSWSRARDAALADLSVARGLLSDARWRRDVAAGGVETASLGYAIERDRAQAMEVELATAEAELAAADRDFEVAQTHARQASSHRAAAEAAARNAESARDASIRTAALQEEARRIELARIAEQQAAAAQQQATRKQSTGKSRISGALASARLLSG